MRNPLIEAVKPLINKRVVIPELPDNTTVIEHLEGRKRKLLDAGFSRASENIQKEIDAEVGRQRATQVLVDVAEKTQARMQDYLVLQLDRYQWEQLEYGPPIRNSDPYSRSSTQRVMEYLKIRSNPTLTLPRTIEYGEVEWSLGIILWGLLAWYLTITVWAGVLHPVPLIISVVSLLLPAAYKVVRHWLFADYTALWRCGTSEYPFDIPDWVITRKSEYEDAKLVGVEITKRNRVRSSAINTQILFVQKMSNLFPGKFHKGLPSFVNNFRLELDPILLGVEGKTGSVLAIWGEDFEDIEDTLRKHAGMTTAQFPLLLSNGDKMICPGCNKNVWFWKTDEGWKCPVCKVTHKESTILDFQRSIPT